MIKIPEVKNVDIDDLLFDVDNPNTMSDEALNALQSSIKQYGFIVPIITNKDFMIADGFHRYKAAVALKMKTVPVIQLPLADVDRRILRQVLNKLKGEHNRQLDIEDLLRIEKDQGMALLTKLLARNDEQTLLQQQSERAKMSVDHIGEADDGYALATIRQLVLFYDIKTYDAVMQKLELLTREFGVEDHTAVLLKLLEEYFA